MADHLKRREDFTDVEPRVFHVDHSLGDEELAAILGLFRRSPEPGTSGR